MSYFFMKRCMFKSYEIYLKKINIETNGSPYLQEKYISWIASDNIQEEILIVVHF